MPPGYPETISTSDMLMRPFEFLEQYAERVHHNNMAATERAKKKVVDCLRSKV